ncbi:zinc ribbon domain-containing protein [Desulfitibacter alkalitolerans]|uniref:zinc ribbon domain-containing protein n=1 Tax=Desulfitibacter alkalitolerans TaxID=264641 RepID=UPI000A00E53F|nr:zinc-ribbon domain-containing protein [Desulfitibacter alkalitolerans]
MMSKKFSYSVSYTYDKLNRLTSAVYSNGIALKYSYDQVGNLISIDKKALGFSETKAVASAANSCKNCKAEILPGTKFCVECGTPVPASMEAKSDKQAAYCTSCGQEAPSGSKFCINCGSPVK